MHEFSQASHRGQIRGWMFDDMVFERHSGTPADLPRHAHDAFQIGTTTRDPGEYDCAGRRWLAPPGSMMVFHPGEVHSASRGIRSRTDISKILFVAPARMRRIASGLDTPLSSLPRFAAPVIRDRRFIRRFTAFHDLVHTDAPVLEKESLLLSVLGTLIARFGADRHPAARIARNRANVLRVREYLEAHYAENVSLAALAELARMSPYHLSREFAREVGMPPHAFQTQLRVERAKASLLAGMPLAEVALDSGFCDQSHLSRHFRRIVGVTPSQYANPPQCAPSSPGWARSGAHCA